MSSSSNKEFSTGFDLFSAGLIKMVAAGLSLRLVGQVVLVFSGALLLIRMAIVENQIESLHVVLGILPGSGTLLLGMVAGIAAIVVARTASILLRLGGLALLALLVCGLINTLIPGVMGTQVTETVSVFETVTGLLLQVKVFGYLIVSLALFLALRYGGKASSLLDLDRVRQEREAVAAASDRANF